MPLACVEAVQLGWLAMVCLVAAMVLVSLQLGKEAASNASIALAAYPNSSWACSLASDLEVPWVHLTSGA